MSTKQDKERLKKLMAKVPPDEVRALLEEVEQENPLQAPLVQDPIDWTGVLSMAIAIRDEFDEKGYDTEDDNPHYIYEGVMKSIFGQDYFKWAAAREKRG